jgi:osmotically-inducible protein OsmY
MFGRNAMPDKDLLKGVNQRLARTGTSQSKVSAAVQHGTVTLTGDLQYEGQRGPIVKAASRAPGVRQVVDQMKLGTRKCY